MEIDARTLRRPSIRAETFSAIRRDIVDGCTGSDGSKWQAVANPAASAAWERERIV
jgi:hypothetical protein